ncbi:MliC family protein [Devosia sp.]|uniref:MliC family protein n=1 Tax=Devosia sp. TaxID=1871048 RepID=UPI002AFED6DC|nr:MliC family protein [Devosia sp.]
MSLTRSLPAALCITLAALLPAGAQEEATSVPQAASASLTLTLESSGDIERKLALYQCDEGPALTVYYINAAPNFLAIVPVDGQNHVFAAALSASGARYVSGPYEWWSKGGDATLRDLTQDEDAAPLAQCTESSNTP